MLKTAKPRAALVAIAAIVLLGVGAADPATSQTIPLRGAHRVRIEASGGPLFITTNARSSDRLAHLHVAYTTARPPTIESYTHDGWLDVSILTSGASMLPFVGSDPTRFDVAVPQALPIQAHAFNGDVTIEKPTAAVQVDDGTGAVAVTNARAGVDLATERGDLQVTLAPNWRSSSIRLETGNGNISLSVPANFRGHVIVAAPSGRVHNELSPAAMHAKSPFVWLNTGKGDASITISH